MPTVNFNLFSSRIRLSHYLFANILLLILNEGSAFEGKITVEPNYVFVKYAHELKGETSGFHHAIDVSPFNNVAPINCAKNGNIFCLQWSDAAKLQITKKDDQCDVYKLSSKNNKPLKVRFDTTNVYLYGGPEHELQKWPADFIEYDKYSYIIKGGGYSSGKVEPLWLVTNGMYLYVDQTVPLFISQNKNEGYFELIASKESPYIRKSDTTQLKYTLCKLDNVKEAALHAIKYVLGKPRGIPDERMVRYPIWSTWAKYKAKINTQVVLDFAKLITESGLPNSQLQIDDNWETCYGSLTVDTGKFEDMKGLVQQLKKKGFRVTLWVHPFVNVGCEPYYAEAVQKKYFVRNGLDSVESKWWNGEAGQIDFTNPEAKAWWQNRLKKLQVETGIDSFKFDAGESTWSPMPVMFHQVAEDQPETNLKYYIQVAAEFGPMIEVRVGRGTQEHPIFVRMNDRESNWNGKLGLGTLIPTLLQMNVLGYPFVLPDMVGGNGYNEDVSEELYIRWLQANVFMPSIQFSYIPSEYGNRGLRLAKKFVDLHVQYSDKIIEAMKNSVKYGIPVNPPIWWIDPTDHQSYLIDSEFLLGEDILVAPVVQQGVQSRDIYLPKGHWRDEVNKNADIIKGPVWLYNYPADLEVLPYFTKVAAAPDTVGKEDHHEDKKSGAGITLPALSSILIALIVGKLFNFRRV